MTWYYHSCKVSIHIFWVAIEVICLLCDGYHRWCL